jgi:CheY-like chemotaxis protein
MAVAVQSLFQIEAVDDNWRRLLRTPFRASALQDSGAPVRRTDSPKRVLIVEDDVDSARSMHLLISDMGHRAEYAINGYVALDMVRGFRPDIVLLDLGLPGVDGFDVCRRIKNDYQSKHIRVAVITGYAHEEYRVRAKAAGCDLHLIKPVAPAVIESVLDYTAAP